MKPRVYFLRKMWWQQFCSVKGLSLRDREHGLEGLHGCKRIRSSWKVKLEGQAGRQYGEKSSCRMPEAFCQAFKNFSERFVCTLWRMRLFWI